MSVGRAALPWAVGLGLVVLSAWVVHQGGVTPAEAGSWRTFAGVVLIGAEALPMLAVWWLGAAGYGYAMGQ
ncbi:MAG: hypothetical protein AAFX76_10945, partial [Planctomycetota bacterium]